MTSSPAGGVHRPPRGPDGQDIRVVVHPDGPDLVIRIIGEADLRTAATLRRTVRDALASTSRPVIVDLSGLDFCDLSGLDALHDVQADAAASDRQVRFRGMPPLVSWMRQTFVRAGGAAASPGMPPLTDETGPPGAVTLPDGVPVPTRRTWPTR